MKNKLIALITLTAISSFITKINCYAVDRITLVQPNSVNFVTTITANNSLIGADAAKEDTQLTLEDMLTYALQDEYLARARYLLTVEKFGQQRPFVNILKAEETHINHLKPLFTKYNVSLPSDNLKDYVKVPNNINESLEAGVQGEIKNIEMYEKFLK
jgi:hypothetical protein